MKWKLQEKWWDLTDDEITEMEWSAEAMSWILQAKYGMTKEEVDDALIELSENLSD